MYSTVHICARHIRTHPNVADQVAHDAVMATEYGVHERIQPEFVLNVHATHVVGNVVLQCFQVALATSLSAIYWMHSFNQQQLSKGTTTTKQQQTHESMHRWMDGWVDERVGE